MPIESIKPAREPGLILRNVRRGALVVAGALLSFYGRDSRLDLAGDLHQRRSAAEIEAEVTESTRLLYEASDAAGKYELAYLQPERAEKTVKVGSLEGGNGLLGKLDAFFRGDNLAKLYHPVGKICLTGSAYDTVLPEWPRRNEPDARPAELLEFGEIIVIQPSNNQLPPIQFRYDVDSASLIASDETTEFMLLGNGCEPAS